MSKPKSLLIASLIALGLAPSVGQAAPDCDLLLYSGGPEQVVDPGGVGCWFGGLVASQQDTSLIVPGATHVSAVVAPGVSIAAPTEGLLTYRSGSTTIGTTPVTFFTPPGAGHWTTDHMPIPAGTTEVVIQARFNHELHSRTYPRPV